jgi:hypothetical protein
MADESRGVAHIMTKLSFGFSSYESSNDGATSTYSALPKRLSGSEHLVLHVTPILNQFRRVKSPQALRASLPDFKKSAEGIPGHGILVVVFPLSRKSMRSFGDSNR